MVAASEGACGICYAPRHMGKHDRTIEVIGRGVLVRDGRVLLCRSVEHGYSYLPGGHVEFGEAAARAVEREFEEETGLQVRAGGLALVTEAAFSTRGKDHHEINLVFHMEPPTGTPPPAVHSREAEIAFDWVDLAAVGERDVRPPAIRDWLVGLAAGEGRRETVAWASEIKAAADESRRG